MEAGVHWVCTNHGVVVEPGRLELRRTSIEPGGIYMQSLMCSRCHQGIHQSRVRAIPTICDHCGFVVSLAEGHVQESLERSLLKSAVAVSFGIVSLCIFVGSWGSCSLEIITLKGGDLAEFNSASY